MLRQLGEYYGTNSPAHVLACRLSSRNTNSQNGDRRGKAQRRALCKQNGDRNEEGSDPRDFCKRHRTAGFRPILRSRPRNRQRCSSSCRHGCSRRVCSGTRYLRTRIRAASPRISIADASFDRSRQHLGAGPGRGQGRYDAQVAVISRTPAEKSRKSLAALFYVLMPLWARRVHARNHVAV